MVCAEVYLSVGSVTGGISPTLRLCECHEWRRESEWKAGSLSRPCPTRTVTVTLEKTRLLALELG